MKRIAIIAIMLITAGLCLAQSDSAKPAADTTKTKIQVEQTTDDSTTVTVTTEKGAADTTTTVTVRSGRERRRRMPPRAKWVLGVRANRINDLPGALFIYRRYRNNMMAGLGIDYAKDPTDFYVDIPYANGNGNWSQRDEYSWGPHIENSSYHSWRIILTPELLFTRMRKGWSTFAGLQGNFIFGKARGRREVTDYNYSYTGDTITTVYDGWGSVQQYGVNIVLGLDKLILIKKQRFSAGFVTNFIGASYSKNYGITTSTDGQIYRTYEIKRVNPWNFSIRNPFNGSIALQLKWWF